MQVIEEICVESSIKGIQDIEASIDRFFESQRINLTHYGNFFVAVSEAATNAQLHGNKNQQDKKIIIKYCKVEDGYCICVKDEGPGFKYNNIPDPTLPDNLEKINVRGIFLMKNLADKVDFSDHGKEVHLYFSFQEN